MMSSLPLEDSKQFPNTEQLFQNYRDLDLPDLKAHVRKTSELGQGGRYLVEISKGIYLDEELAQAPSLVLLSR